MADYPDSFDPTPEKIYSIKMVGGIIPEGKDNAGDRYPNPRIHKKEYDKKDGTGKYWGWNVTIFAKEVVFIEGIPETDDKTLGEWTFWIPEEVREQVDEYFNASIMKFYLIRKSIWYKDNKGKNKTKSQYQVSAGLSGLQDTPKVEPKPETTPIPYEDDEVALEEDIKPKVKVKTTINQMPITSSSMDTQILVGTLQSIEKSLASISLSFKQMLAICKGVRLVKKE